MIWDEVDLQEVDDAPAVRHAVDAARPRGLHLSQIRDALVRATFPDLYGNSGDPATDPDAARLMATRMEAGEGFEELLETALLERHERHADVTGLRPEPIQLDGIWMSADRVVLEGDAFVIEEHKATWYSARQGIRHRKFWGWWVQLAAYCWGWETTRGRFRIFFVNDDYSAYCPRVRRYDITFPPEVLQQNWAMLVGHARRKGWL